MSSRPHGSTDGSLPAVRVVIEAPVARVTLSRPQTRNALSVDMLDAIVAAAAEVARDDAVRAVVLDAAGPVVASGHDLRELSAGERDDHEAVFAACRRTMEALRRLEVPVIAQVDGLATAAGCQLVASCDLAVASERAAFATPGVRIGLFCSTPMVPLTAIVGPRRALEMLLTGEPIDAATALDWGLVNRVVPEDQLEVATLELAHAVVRWSRDVVADGKRTFYAHLGRSESGAYDLTTPAMVDAAGRADAREGIAAFLDKRPPRWRRPEA